jgi:hypothetical protein
MVSFRPSLVIALLAVVLCVAAKKSKDKDPRECEVCIANLQAVDDMLDATQKKDKVAVREAIGKRCTKSGFGSEWKPNPDLTSPKDVKM